MAKKYLPKEIESKWQEKWKKNKLFSPDLDKAKDPYYALMMFPYPSAEGLHVGNVYAFTGADIHARFMRMQGHDVFEPIGLDGFGIHSENYALKIGKHPAEQSKINEKRFYAQLLSIGNSFDWQRTVETYKPEYYRWTQWLFLKMYEKGLAYKAQAEVNWCPSCKTVLADEQVINDRCERCSTVVKKKELEQWFFKITKYADRLLKNLDKLDWSAKVKIAQRNWIGRSEGLQIKFKVQSSKFKVEEIEIFTTRPETTDGATSIALSPEHQLAKSHKPNSFTGLYAINPVNKKKIPVWVADYVLSEYGTGAIMAVPWADERDREFAKEHKLPIIKTNFKAKPKGKKVVNYHLRDWLISRQRYWGPPIPIIYCDQPAGGCGTVPVPEKDLPVELPYVKDFQPKGTGQSPLATVEEFYKVKCPKCGNEAKRETDVSDTFLDSAWYFLRYTSTDIDDEPFNKERTKRWLPVNSYIGGAEHSVLHLLYARFITMALKDFGLISHFEEPFSKFRAHGLLISEGAKMSKSKGNVVNPDDYIKEYGADTLRMYLMFIGPYDQGGDFRDQAIGGIYKFLNRVWNVQFKLPSEKFKVEERDLREMHKTIKKVTEDIEHLRYNTAISALMEWINFLTKKTRISNFEFRNFLLLLAPFAPHMTEELYSKPESIHLEKWPEYDPKYLVEDKITVPVQVDGKLRATIVVDQDKSSEKEVVDAALQSHRVKKYLEGRDYKVIYVKGRILNFITGKIQ